MRDKPMRWPMGDTRLWERHAYEMAPVKGTPIRWPMRDARLCTPMRDVPMRDTPMGWSL